MRHREAEQKLIDLTFEIVITAHMHREWFEKATREEVAAWVADQLKKCGYPTTPCGMSWGVLDK